MELILAACVLGLALCWSAREVAKALRAVHVTHAHTGLAAPLVSFAESWWEQARDVPAGVVTAEPVVDTSVMDAATDEGVATLRELYAAQGVTRSDAELREEARELVWSEFGT